MKDGAVFPPVILFNDGKDFWIADGYHRLLASESIGLSEIVAEVRQETRRDAVLFSCSANATHGLRRSAADKRRAVLTLLQDADWSKWSNREIARRSALSPGLVDGLRKSLPILGSERTYLTKHGTLATMNTTNIGKTARPTDKQPKPTAACENPPDIVGQELDERDQQLGLKDQRTVTYPLPEKVESQNQDILLAFAKNLDLLSHEQLKFVGIAIARARSSEIFSAMGLRKSTESENVNSPTTLPPDNGLRDLGMGQPAAVGIRPDHG